MRGKITAQELIFKRLANESVAQVENLHALDSLIDQGRLDEAKAIIQQMLAWAQGKAVF